MQDKNLISFLCVLWLSMLSCADDTTAWNAGQSFGSTVKTAYGTNIKSTLIEPMTSTSSQFTTLDGSKTFSANMTCGDTTKNFITITYNLGSPQNGIVPIVKIDKDLDGTMDYTYTSPYTASAICSNGIAVCPSGNFTANASCSYYQWSYNGSALSLVSVASNTMTQCKCVNDTCNSPAKTEKDSLVSTISSNVYSAISSYSTKYIVSDVNITSGVAYYYGQRTDACSNYQGTVATTGTSSTIDASAEMITQGSNNDSSYTALLGTSSNYSANSPSVTTQVSTTISSSKSALSSTTNTDGTTDFGTKDYSTSTSINGHVGIPLTSEDDKYCQVQWLGTSNEVFTDSTERSTATTSGEQWQTETRLCVNDVCPYSASKGESIKHDCGNINNFSEAAGAFAALQELADDITCGSI